MADARAPIALWRSVRGLPEFWRLLELRPVSQFGDGLFQAGLAGAILFNPERAADAVGDRRRLRGAVPAVLAARPVRRRAAGPLGPAAGADRRQPRAAAAGARCRARCWPSGAGDLPILFGALIVNGFTRFVSSGLSAALPHVVPRDQVVTMNSVATATGAAAAFLGANFMLLPRWLFGAGDTGAAAIIFIVAVPVAVALWLSCALPAAHARPRRQRAGDPRLGGLRGGHRLAARRPHRRGRADGGGDAGRAGRPPHGVRHQHIAGAGDRAAQRHRGRSPASAPRWCSSPPPAPGRFSPPC